MCHELSSPIQPIQLSMTSTTHPSPTVPIGMTAVSYINSISKTTRHSSELSIWIVIVLLCMIYRTFGDFLQTFRSEWKELSSQKAISMVI